MDKLIAERAMPVCKGMAKLYPMIYKNVNTVFERILKMRKIIAFLIVSVLIFSMSSVAFAGYHEYSGGANNYFDTRSLDRVGTSWSYARDECTSSATERDSPYASPHKSKVVSGSTALSNELTVWGGDSVTLTFKSGANNYSSAKLRLSAISSYGYFYAVGKFYAA